MLSFIKNVIFYLSLFIASCASAEEYSVTRIEQNAEKTIYQICINVQKTMKLDVSSVMFECEDPHMSIQSWRLINPRHDLTCTNDKKIIVFQITTSGLPNKEGVSLIHCYCVELTTKIPHHYLIALSQNTTPEPVITQEEFPAPINQDDYIMTKGHLKRGLLKVLKTPITGIQYLMNFVFTTLNTIIKTPLLLILLLLLLGFFMGIMPFFYAALIVLLLGIKNEEKIRDRLFLTSMYGIGFFTATLLQITSFLNLHAIINNAAVFTGAVCGFFGILAYHFLIKPINLVRTKMPAFAYMPLGFLMGFTTTAWLLNTAQVLAPWFIDFLAYTHNHAMLFMYIAGLSLFLITISLCAYPWLKKYATTPWQKEMNTYAGIIFAYGIIGMISFIVPANVTGIFMAISLFIIAIFYAWKTTQISTHGLRRLRTCISLFCFCIALILASKLIIQALC